MAKAATLSARAVQTLHKPGMHLDGRGLYLRIGPGGSKSWVYRFALAGKTRDMGLGPYPEISLAEAREQAAAQRKLRLDGTDPIAVRQAGRQQAKLNSAKLMTFRACAEAYIAAHRAGWKNPKHAAQWPATLSAYAYPVFGDLQVQVVDVGLVMKAVEPIWTTKRETASRCAAGSKASWIGRRRVATARATTRPVGEVTSKICYPRRPRFGGSSTMQLCPIPSYRVSWPNSGNTTGLPSVLSNSRS